MRKSAFLVVFIPGVLGACGAGDGPLSGEWAYSDEAVEEDSCNVDYSPTSGTFFIENHGDGTFTVDPNDATDPFDCTLDGSSYSCDERFVEDIDIFGLLGRVHATAIGNLRSARSGTGEQQATIACLNQECEDAAAMFGLSTPCSVVVTHKMEWIGE